MYYHLASVIIVIHVSKTTPGIVRVCLQRKVCRWRESLATTIERVVPYFESVIRPQMAEGQRIIIAAHGNSLRALVKYF